jgi:hypothetical protein
VKRPGDSSTRFLGLVLLQLALAGCAASGLVEGRPAAGMEGGRISEKEAQRLSRLWIASATRSPAEFEKRWAETRQKVSQVHAQLDLMEARKEPDRWPRGPWLAAMRTARTPVSKELFRRVVVDRCQQALGNGMDLPARAAMWAALSPRFRRNTRDNTAWLKRILGKIGWFDISAFGEDASEAAWILVQHSDHDPGFQESVLRHLTTAASRGDVNPSHYAYLVDRVAKNAGRPQTYGTQGQCSGGRWKPHIILEPERLDVRRRAAGLEPHREYVDSMICF